MNSTDIGKDTKKIWLAQYIIDNSIGAELAQGATRLVQGHGSLDSPIILIGEAPGKNEDLKGEPFVGSSGKLLNELLGSIDMTRADVYISNIVKYRPPENRDPSKSEKKAFLPILLGEINLIKPKVIVTLGSHSLSMFYDGAITSLHGEPIDLTIKVPPLEQANSYSDFCNILEHRDDYIDFSVTLLPLYHPAAAMYRRSLHDTLFDDFTVLGELMAQR